MSTRHSVIPFCNRSSEAERKQNDRHKVTVKLIKRKAYLTLLSLFFIMGITLKNTMGKCLVIKANLIDISLI